MHSFVNDLKIIALVFLSISTFNVTASPENDNSFAMLCDIFKEAKSLGGGKQKQSEFVMVESEKTLEGSEAYNTLHAILGLNSEDRYPTVKASAEEVLGKVWTCPAMQELLR
ncbi:hypothetical protein [Aurantivibrio plasticivorans]